MKIPFKLTEAEVVMDKRTIPFSNTLNTLEQNIAKPVADASSESASLDYRPPEIIRLGSAVGLMKQSNTGQLIDGNDGWWVWGS